MAKCDRIELAGGSRWVVGSLGGMEALRGLRVEELAGECDLVEVRLDLLVAEGVAVAGGLCAHLAGVPLLFTARWGGEGGAGDLGAAERMALLRLALPNAALVDVEVAQLAAMAGILREAGACGVPWIASFHDFARLPSDEVMEAAARAAREAGAAAFKVAARVHSPADVARLAEFQLADHGLPVASMGMGPLAPVSRLLCAQCGSVLNYGYLGAAPTAPGQWDAGSLKHAIAKLAAVG